MKDDILLSIIIPVYNGERYLSQCLESILKTKKINIEILLIDDGSKDNSYKIIENYATKDSRIKVIKQENCGVSRARNKGIELATAKYIMFVDADDVLNEDWDCILNEIEDKDVYYFSEKLNLKINKEDMLKYIIGINSDKIYIAGAFSKIFKKDFLKNKRIKFNEKLINGEDMLFNIECLLACEDYKVKKFSFYQYRNFIGSATKKFNNKIFESDNLFQRKLENILKINKISNELCQYISLYCKQMAICVFIQRISFLKRYSEARKFYNYLYDEPYKTALSSERIVNKKYCFLLLLAKYKFKFMLYMICKIIYWIKKQEKDGYYFSKI